MDKRKIEEWLDSWISIGFSILILFLLIGFFIFAGCFIYNLLRTL